MQGKTVVITGATRASAKSRRSVWREQGARIVFIARDRDARRGDAWRSCAAPIARADHAVHYRPICRCFAK